MDKTLQDLISIDSLIFALHALAKEHKEVSMKLDAGAYEDDFEYQSDKVERLALALNELAAVYEWVRVADANAPSIEPILDRYD